MSFIVRDARDSASSRKRSPFMVGLAPYYDRATANRTGGRQRASGGVFRELRLQLSNQSRVIRRTAATLGIGQTERARGVDLLDLPCSNGSCGRKGGGASDPCGSRAQQIAAPPSETSQFPISPAFQP